MTELKTAFVQRTKELAMYLGAFGVLTTADQNLRKERRVRQAIVETVVRPLVRMGDGVVSVSPSRAAVAEYRELGLIGSSEDGLNHLVHQKVGELGDEFWSSDGRGDAIIMVDGDAIEDMMPVLKRTLDPVVRADVRKAWKRRTREVVSSRISAPIRREVLLVFEAGDIFSMTICGTQALLAATYERVLDSCQFSDRYRQWSQTSFVPVEEAKRSLKPLYSGSV